MIKKIIKTNPAPRLKPCPCVQERDKGWDITRCGINIVIFLSALFILSGCENNIDKAEKYSAQSQSFYEKAIKEYKLALKNKKDQEDTKLALAKLYSQHKDYLQAIEQLKELTSEEAKKLLAISLFESGDYTDALEIFERLGELKDGQYLFYYGSTCEKLNLYDPALKIYQKIQDPYYNIKAQARIQAINLLDKGEIAYDVLDIIKNSPTQEDFPQAGAVVLLAEEDVKINLDNTAEYSDHFIVKILNERGKEDFSEIVIGYDSTYEKVELEFARTIKPDGTFVSVGDKNIRDVSKYLNFPLYSNARAFIISMPEIQEGSIVEYKAKVYRSRLINKKDFAVSYLLQMGEPIKKAIFNVEIPKERSFNMKLINEEFNDFNVKLKPTITTQGEYKIYSWVFNDIPQIVPEPSSAPLSEITPGILISTFNNWEEIYNWWQELVEDKIEANTAIKQKVKELTEDKATLIEKAKSIYNFCAENIRYVAIEYGQAGHEPHKAEDVFQNKYGDCKDQAVLLITMLKEIGLKAYPVLIGTQGVINLDEHFPTLVFNHAIAVLEHEDKFIFLDPTGETISFFDLPTSDQQRKVLIFYSDRPKIEETPLFEPNHNKVIYNTNISINHDDSISAEREVLTFGGYDAMQRYYFRYTMPILIEENLKNKVQNICPGARLDTYSIKNIKDLNNPIQLYYEFSGEDFLAKAGDLRVLPQLGSIDLGLVVKDRRRYKIDVHRLEELKTQISFKLPKKFKLKYLPRPLEYKTKWFDFINDYSVEDNKIIFSETKRFKNRYIEVEEYLEFKAILEKLAKELNQRVILEEVVSR